MIPTNMNLITHDFIFVNSSLIRRKINKSVYKRIKDDVIEMIAYSLDEELQFLWSEINGNLGFQMYLNQKYAKRSKQNKSKQR